jgi:hypothetical protein
LLKFSEFSQTEIVSICTPLKTPKPPKIVPQPLMGAGRFWQHVAKRTAQARKSGESAVFGHFVGVFDAF